MDMDSRPNTDNVHLGYVVCGTGGVTDFKQTIADSKQLQRYI